MRTWRVSDMNLDRFGEAKVKLAVTLLAAGGTDAVGRLNSAQRWVLSRRQTAADDVESGSTDGSETWTGWLFRCDGMLLCCSAPLVLWGEWSCCEVDLGCRRSQREHGYGACLLANTNAN